MSAKKQLTDSDRLEAIIELLEKIDWKLWEIYQHVKEEPKESEIDRVIKR